MGTGSTSKGSDLHTRHRIPLSKSIRSIPKNRRTKDQIYYVGIGSNDPQISTLLLNFPDSFQTSMGSNPKTHRLILKWIATVCTVKSWKNTPSCMDLHSIIDSAWINRDSSKTIFDVVILSNLLYTQKITKWMDLSNFCNHSFLIQPKQMLMSHVNPSIVFVSNRKYVQTNMPLREREDVE